MTSPLTIGPRLPLAENAQGLGCMAHIKQLGPSPPDECPLTGNVHLLEAAEALPRLVRLRRRIHVGCEVLEKTAQKISFPKNFD